MKNLLICTLCFLLMGFSEYDDHLRPEESALSDPGARFLHEYYLNVAQVLKPQPNEKINAHVVVLPSFSPEYLVGIKQLDHDYQIFSIEPEISIWQFSYIDDFRKNPDKFDSYDIPAHIEALEKKSQQIPLSYDDIRVVRCTVNIPKTVAENLLRVWQSMLLEVRFPPKGRPVLDGVRYHFSMRDKDSFQTLSGKTHSPAQNTKVGKLVALTDKMKKICDDQDLSILPDLDQDARKLLSTFDN